MILKLIILAVVAYYIYKFFGGKLPSFGNSSNSSESKKDVDTMVECEGCSTFISSSEAFIIKGKYYCDECANK
jgi:uncharacterized protein